MFVIMQYTKWYQKNVIIPFKNHDKDGLGMTLGLSRQFGAYNANVGVIHVNAKVDDNTSVFLGLNRAF